MCRSPHSVHQVHAHKEGDKAVVPRFGVQSHCCVVVVVRALQSEIENGRMNVCRLEKASRVEKWNESSVG